MIEMVSIECPVCRTMELCSKSDATFPQFCKPCASKYPPSLLKAAIDSFDYAIGLRTGEVIRFNEAVMSGEFVTLKNTIIVSEHIAFPCPRGIDIRVSEIVWCADAPAGS